MLSSSSLQTCEDVLLNGRLVKARTFLSETDTAELHRLRGDLWSTDPKRSASACCPYCHQRLNLRGGPDEVGEYRSVSLHFAHPPDLHHACIQKTASRFTEAQIRAIKYNGHKESREHRWMKLSIRSALRITPGVDASTIKVERTYRSANDSTWRRPDVSAVMNGKQLIFEAQLDNTHVRVISERTDFYAQNGAFLLWVFAQPPTARFRFSEKDIFFRNKCNLFVFNKDCLDRSLLAENLILHAWWIDPRWLAIPHSERPDSVPWQSKFVRLSDLTFHDGQSAPFFVDAQGQADQISLLAARKTAPADVEISKPYRKPTSDSNWPGKFHYRLKEMLLAGERGTDHRIPQDLMDLVQSALARIDACTEIDYRQLHGFIAFSKAVYSLDNGQPFASRLQNLAGIENWIFDKYPQHYRKFCYALRGSERLRNLTRSQRATHDEHKRKFRQRIADGDASSTEDHTFDALIDKLWPWIRLEMNRPTHRVSTGQLVPSSTL